MQDQKRMCFVIVTKEARDLSTDNEERCEVQKESHQLEYTIVEAKPTVKTADRSKRFFNPCVEENIQKPFSGDTDQNRSKIISKKIKVNDNNETWTESKTGQTVGENDSRDSTRENINHGIASPQTRQKSAAVNSTVTRKKSKVQNLRRYDNEKKKNDNEKSKREDGDENGADIAKPKRKRFRKERQKDRLNNSKKVDQIEKEKSNPLIDNNQTPQRVENRHKQVSSEDIYFSLSCIYRFLRDKPMNVCLLAVVFNMLFHGGSCAMHPKLELVVHPISPQNGQTVIMECMLTDDDTQKYHELIFQILRKCANQTHFQAVCFFKNTADITKFSVEKADPKKYICKLMDFGIPDECDYRCDKGPAKSNIISIKIDNVKPRNTESLNIARVVGCVGTAVAVVCVVILVVFLVRKQRFNKEKNRNTTIRYIP